jgi:hypothetical protein
MIVNYTKKLFYRKYPYRVTIETATEHTAWSQEGSNKLGVLQTWLTNNCNNTGFKMVNRYMSFRRNKPKDQFIYNQVCYIQSEELKNQLVTAWANNVLEISHPHDINHLNLLEPRNEILVRTKPIYNKYMHIVYFAFDYDENIYNWLKKYFSLDDETVFFKKSRYFRVQPTIYLKNDDYLAEIKLYWGDSIECIKTVKLIEAVKPENQMTDLVI